MSDIDDKDIEKLFFDVVTMAVVSRLRHRLPQSHDVKRAIEIVLAYDWREEVKHHFRDITPDDVREAAKLAEPPDDERLR